VSDSIVNAAHNSLTRTSARSMGIAATDRAAEPTPAGHTTISWRWTESKA
jgi:hypothetical protein